MNRRVLVGMSGGIDSTAATLLLKRQGFDVVGLTIWNHGLGSDDVGSEPEYIDDARRAADRLGIEHFVADERGTFERDVVRPFLQGWMDGVTPNPCVECNPNFKFRILTEQADRLGCDFIATGHYASVCCDEGWHYIVRAEDGLKDQSYFLWRLGQDVLRRTIFPLGHMTKSRIRKLVAEEGIPMRESNRESMEICFIESDYRDFLRQRVPDIDSKIGPGRFVDSEGHIIGQHRGYPFYTVGQRKGLEVAFGSPRYVLKTNPDKNTVMLGLPEQLETEYMLVSDMVLHPAASKGGLQVKIRYRSRPVPCIVCGPADEGRTLIRFLEPASAVAPGQSAVFYCSDRVVGGAVISSQRGIGQFIISNNEDSYTV